VICLDAVAQQGKTGVYLPEHDIPHACKVKFHCSGVPQSCRYNESVVPGATSPSRRWPKDRVLAGVVDLPLLVH